MRRRRLPHRNAIAALEEQVRVRLTGDSTGHDPDHVARVRNLGAELVRREGGDALVVEAAALLHDLFRPEEQRTGTLHFGPEARTAMRALLDAAAFPEERIPAVLDCVAVHEQYASANGAADVNLEASILQDADRLDAIGAIGIARAFMFAGAHGRPMWIPDEVPGVWNPSERPTGSAITHVREKLLTLAARMNTPTARAWAAARHAVVEQFLEEFLAEWNGHPTRHGEGARHAGGSGRRSDDPGG